MHKTDAYLEAFNTFDEIIFLKDKTSKQYKLVNKVFEEIFLKQQLQLSLDDVIGKTDYELKWDGVKQTDFFRRKDEEVIEKGELDTYIQKAAGCFVQGTKRLTVFERKPTIMGRFNVMNEYECVAHTYKLLLEAAYKGKLNELFEKPICPEHHSLNVNDQTIDLTKTETQCLIYATIGRTYFDIAKITNKALGTVKSHMANIRCKFKVSDLHTLSEIVSTANKEHFTYGFTLDDLIA